MVKTQTIIKHRCFVLFMLALASIIFTGCDKGSLGIKTGAIQGYVIDVDTNQPISDVLIKAEGLTGNGATENKTTYTQGDGSFIISDTSKGTWTITPEKYGYVVATDTVTQRMAEYKCTTNNGETFTLSPIKLSKTNVNVKGSLKGYPVDAITGRAITNFTVYQETPYNERKSKTFETAADFKSTGWTGLEGGIHNYSISANNYEIYNTTTTHANGIEIGKSPVDLGTIKMQPLSVDISGTFRNVPGYILSGDKSIVVWAESAGKVVASYTELGADNSKGTITYSIAGVPVTAGSVAIKCKVKGYDVITINSAVSIPNSNPGGVIAGVDIDFSVQEPIRSDLRVIVTGNKPTDDEGEKESTFNGGEVARVYVQCGGNDVVPYCDVTSVNYGGEVTISGVITGYPIKVLVINQNKKYCKATSEDITIPEGTEIYPVTVTLEEN